MQTNIAAPTDGATVMMPPKVDQVAMPPRREAKSTLEDAGNDPDAIDVELRDQTQMLAKVASRICELAQQKLLPSVPTPAAGEAPPAVGNPFKTKGAFKYHHVIFRELLTGWKSVDQLNKVIDVELKAVAEATLISYIKAVGCVNGYNLHHDEPSNTYCLSQG
jgi:hypothetical protein